MIKKKKNKNMVKQFWRNLLPAVGADINFVYINN